MKDKSVPFCKHPESSMLWAVAVIQVQHGFLTSTECCWMSFQDCNNLLDGVLRCKRKHFVVPSRIRLECLEEAEWRMLPVNLPPLTTRQSPGGEMHVAFERQRKFFLNLHFGSVLSFVHNISGPQRDGAERL